MEDNIVYFSDRMDSEVLQTAHKHAKECDVMVCLGSSFMVQPACSLVARGKPSVIICNRQHTRWDS